MLPIFHASLSAAALALLFQTPPAAPTPAPEPPGTLEMPGMEPHDHEKAPAKSPQELERARALKASASRLTPRELNLYLERETALGESLPPPSSELSPARFEEIRSFAWELYLRLRGARDGENARAGYQFAIAEARQAGVIPDTEALTGVRDLDRILLVHQTYLRDFATKFGAKTLELLTSRKRDFMALLDREDRLKSQRTEALEKKAAAQLDDATFARYLDYFREVNQKNLDAHQREELLKTQGLDTETAAGFAYLANTYYALDLGKGEAQKQLDQSRQRLDVAAHARQSTSFEELMGVYQRNILARLERQSLEFTELFGAPVTELFQKNRAAYLDLMKGQVPPPGASEGSAPGTPSPPEPTP